MVSVTSLNNGKDIYTVRLLIYTESREFGYETEKEEKVRLYT